MARPQVRQDLQELSGYHSPQVDVDIRLNTNEAPDAPPAAFSEAVADAVRTLQWHRYPDRAASELRTRIGQLHGVGPEQIFVANGSNEVLQTVLLTFAGAGRTTMTFEPTYALHSHLTRISGATTIAVRRNDDFTLDVDAACSAIREQKPSVVFICTPNNPSGIVEPKVNVEALLAACVEVSALLVVDEAYGQFSSWTAQDLLDEQTPMVVSRTYSKTWAMAGARLGYLIGPTWIVDELEKVVLPYHLDLTKQIAGLAALDFVGDMEQRVAEIVGQREHVTSSLRDMGATVWTSGANFILFRPPNGNGAEVWQQLLDRSILVRNTASWEGLDGCLRVTIGQPHENAAFLEAMADILGAASTGA